MKVENSIKEQKMKESSKKAVSQIHESEQLPNDEDESSLIAEQKFSLYVRGSAWIKDRENAVNRLKEIEPRIQDVRHPRQKSANYCFIDFESALDRDQSYEKLKTHAELKVNSVTTNVPRLLEKRRQKIVEKREAKEVTKKLIAQIKKKDKPNTKAVEKTNQIVMLNVPKQVTQGDLKGKYPNAIKVVLRETKKNMKNRRTAIISFPNHRDAYAASKEESINLHGQKINVLLNTINLFKQNAKKKATKKKANSEESQEPPKKLPKTEKIEK